MAGREGQGEGERGAASELRLDADVASESAGELAGDALLGEGVVACQVADAPLRAEGEEVAALMDLPAATVHSRLRLAREVFRRSIERHRARERFEARESYEFVQQEGTEEKRSE